MNTTPLDHYTLELQDPSTIIITGHFMRREDDDFEAVPSWATMTVSLKYPVTRIDDEFHAVQDDPAEFEPADLSEFYGLIDQEDQDALWTAQGKDPAKEKARLDRDIERHEQDEKLILVDCWRDPLLCLPEDLDSILFYTGPIKLVEAGTFSGGEFYDASGYLVPLEEITYWMPRPEAPNR